MFPEHTGASEAVVICTRNRPVDLARTLKSVAEQCRAHDRPVVVVDGSDRDDAERTAGVVQSWGDEELPFSYHRHSGRPAGTRQRNVGVDLLPETVRIVHFIDDDVTVHPGYFEALSAVLRTEPNVGGWEESSLSPPKALPRPVVSDYSPYFSCAVPRTDVYSHPVAPPARSSPSKTTPLVFVTRNG
ncbi:glycosyltransferase family A protein [Salinibacter ruber]|uniref:glycosyltransferase family A protein n=1 Tax=Salinibacter ruber TaxID=146919 RepID=UPI003C6DF7ED